jgi:glycerol uptake facilitator-like aquaporin
MNRYLAEWTGTALLLAIVTGSGVMAETLSAGNVAVALLGNSIATGAGLYVLITLLAPVSGAHFNPSVSLMCWSQNELSTPQLVGYLGAQLTGAVFGVWLTHVMFSLPVIQVSQNAREGWGVWVSELVATMTLLCVIKAGARHAPEKVPLLVALIVTAGYWFTSSTFFSNPAVTLARSLTNTFVGIRPVDVIGFVGAQLLATSVVVMILRLTRK